MPIPRKSSRVFTYSLALSLLLHALLTLPAGVIFLINQYPALARLLRGDDAKEPNKNNDPQHRDPAHTPPPPPDPKSKEVRLGIESSPSDSVVWMGFDKATPHEGPKSEVDQSAITSKQAGVPLDPGVQTPPAQATEPTPAPAAQSPAPAPAQPETPAPSEKSEPDAPPPVPNPDRIVEKPPPQPETPTPPAPETPEKPVTPIPESTPPAPQPPPPQTPESKAPEPAPTVPPSSPPAPPASTPTPDAVKPVSPEFVPATRPPEDVHTETPPPSDRPPNEAEPAPTTPVETAKPETTKPEKTEVEPAPERPIDPVKTEAALAEVTAQAADSALKSAQSIRERLAALNEWLARTKQELAAAHAKPQTPQPAPILPTAATPPAPAGAPVASGDPGVEGDKDSDASSTSVTGEYRNGKVLAGEGLDIKTVRPNFSKYTRVTAVPQDPIVEIWFDSKGVVRNVELKQSSGYRDVDEPVKNAVWAWTAKGKILKELAERKPNGTVKVEITLLLRGG